MFSEDFGPFEGRIWLNCAHQGPMPRAAVQAAHQAIRWKQSPVHLDDESFGRIPLRLKKTLGKLVDVPSNEIVLTNSTSYGLHLLANGFPWKSGDEILLKKGDFPANILPWIALKKRGVVIRFIQPQTSFLQISDIERHVTPDTRLLCLSWVDSFSGHAVDWKAVGELCRIKGIIFVLNGSQALGARPINLKKSSVDAFTCCGFKWLCGPYGTGFCWLEPELLDSLEYNQAYWLAMQGRRNFNRMKEYEIRKDLGASVYDVFCTANFLNFMPWTAAVEYLLKQGTERIRAYDDLLVSRLIEGLDPEKFKLISPGQENSRSTLVVLTHRTQEKNKKIYRSLKQNGVDIAKREGNLRVSPHLYNTTDEIEYLLSLLHSV